MINSEANIQDAIDSISTLANPTSQTGFAKVIFDYLVSINETDTPVHLWNGSPQGVQKYPMIALQYGDTNTKYMSQEYVHQGKTLFIFYYEKPPFTGAQASDWLTKFARWIISDAGVASISTTDGFSTTRPKFFNIQDTSFLESGGGVQSAMLRIEIDYHLNFDPIVSPLISAIKNDIVYYDNE